MKRIIALLLCAVMLFSLTACGEDKGAASSVADVSSKVESKVEATSSVAASSAAPVVKKNPVKIMPLGDSLTQGGDHDNSGAYRKPLGEMLDKAGLTYEFVGSHNWSKDNITNGQIMHSGYGGIQVLGLDKELEKMKDCDPDIVLLMVGRNDNTNGITADTFTNLLYNNIISVLYEMFPGVTVYVGSIPPARRKVDGVGIEELSNASNDKAQGVTYEATKKMVEDKKAAGDKIEFVDMSAEASGMTWEDFDAEDTVHPLMSGYEKIANQWYNAIEKQAFELEKELNP